MTTNNIDKISKPDYQIHQVEQNWKNKLSSELKEYYIKFDHAEIINEQINEIIDTELKNDTIGPPSERGYICLKQHIIEKINKIIRH